MITGAHAILFSSDADATRAFLKDKLEFDSVDAGNGWLIFALPPAELAVHPAESPSTQLYLMCDDIHTTIAALRAHGVVVREPVTDQGWGLLTSIGVPGVGELGLYEPRHPTPHERKAPDPG